MCRDGNVVFHVLFFLLILFKKKSANLPKLFKQTILSSFVTAQNLLKKNPKKKTQKEQTHFLTQPQTRGEREKRAHWTGLHYLWHNSAQSPSYLQPTGNRHPVLRRSKWTANCIASVCSEKKNTSTLNEISNGSKRRHCLSSLLEITVNWWTVNDLPDR